MGLFSNVSKDAQQAKWEAKRAKDMDRMLKEQKNMSRREQAKVARKHGK